MFKICNGFLMFSLIFIGCTVVTGSANVERKGQRKDLINFSFSQNCPQNRDSRYDRKSILKKIHRMLKKSTPNYKEFPGIGFFIYDLTDPTNNYRSKRFLSPQKGCINFINKHVYHISPAELASSISTIIILDDGKMKVFKSINCNFSKYNLDDVLSYVNNKLKEDQNKDDVITRLKHYRRYGKYWTVDQLTFSCTSEKRPRNIDKQYSRWEILRQFGGIISNLLSKKDINRSYPVYYFGGSRVAGFFVYDLTEPSNKQTSLLERVEFKNNHIYHFADIDLPYSFSNIAILEDGKLKIFKTINCEGKGDSLDDVVDYLNKKLNGDKNKDEIIKRVKSYREYGVYVSFNGRSAPQCDQVILDNEAKP